MLSVRNRRRLAVVIIVVFAAVSLTITYIAARDYSPSALARSAAGAFDSATGLELRTEGARVAIEGALDFDRVSVLSGGDLIASARNVRVVGLPSPLGGWHPSRIETGPVTLYLDLEGGDPGVRAAQFARMAEESGDMDLSLLDTTDLILQCGKAFRARYGILGAGLLIGEPLVLKWADGEAADSGLELSTEGLSLSALLGESPDPLALFLAGRTLSATEWLAAAASADEGGGTGTQSAAPAEGAVWDAESAKSAARRLGSLAGARLEALWNAEGLLLTLRFEGEGLKVAEPARLLGMDINGGEAEAVVGSVSFREDRLEGLEGRVSAAWPRIAAESLSALAKLAGLAGPEAVLGGQTFENVRMEARFELAAGTVSVAAVEGMPGLAWSEVEGEPIVLLEGAGETAVDELRRKASEVKVVAGSPAPAEGTSPVTP